MPRLLAVGLALASMSTVLVAQNTATSPAASEVVNTYCLSCHDGRAPAGRISLEQLDATEPSGAADIWERVVRQLRARTMPPVAALRPDNQTYDSAIAALTGALDRGAT